MSDDLSIRPVLFLAFLAALAPAALVFSVWSSGHTYWYNPAAHGVLGWSVAVLALVIANWLARELKLNPHPALAVLVGGFIGLAIINIVASFVHDPVHLVEARSVITIWLMAYGGSAAFLLDWQGLRRPVRQFLMDHKIVFYSLLALSFAVLGGATWALDDPLFHAKAFDKLVRILTYIVAFASISILLALTFRLYLRKRNTVILFFNVGLYLYALSILCQTSGEVWSISWWFGQGLSLISVFAIAYGILEATRVRDRLELIKTLASRTQELQKFHEDLGLSESRYRSLVNNAPYGIFRLNALERFEAVNPALVELLGHESERPLMQQLFSALFKDPVQYSSMMQEVRETGRVQDQVIWLRKDGAAMKARLECRKVTEEPHGTPFFEGTVEDLSEQSSLEEQLRQSQKMEAVGRLAGGIAHDFNNLLTIISGYTGMLIDTFSTNDPRRGDAERVKSASERAAALTRQLLAFSRKQVLTPTTLDLNRVVSDLSKILPRLIGEDIDLAFVPGGPLGSVYADRGQVEQVIMNLVVNSRDAMPKGGKITLETANRKLDEKYTRHRRGIIPGEYVMLAVTDTGCGMDEATKARLFEPFFTTKEEGKGTGLGLATVYGIVKQSGGHISVYSEPDKGTCFQVYFPATSIPHLPERETALPNFKAQGETILVVEDETDLRKMIVQALERRGYQVLEASSGEEAIQIVHNGNASIRLLITDIVMAGMSGTEAVQKILPLVPNMKIIYMSGYTDNAMFHQKLLDTGSIFIQKPFTADGLEEKVRTALKMQAQSA
ncbi:MAG TPA: ATP-binding protein [Candidatus Angelobacter sp.]|nr:ATP-binding protein [Candidatus Angelobacter sp.]